LDKKEDLEYFYVIYQTNSVFYIKKIIRSLKNRRALWRSDLVEDIKMPSEMSKIVHLAAHKNATELMFIGNFDSNKPMIRLYDTSLDDSFSNLLSGIELICRNPVNDLTYKKVTTTKIYEDNLYALFNYDDSSLSYSALCVFDLSKLENDDQIIGHFLHGYSVIDNNDHLRSLAVNDKFITVLSTSGKLFLSTIEDTPLTEVDILPESEPDSNVQMDIAGQHLLISLDTNFYLCDLNAPKPTLPPITLKIIQTANDNHEELLLTEQPYIEEDPVSPSVKEIRAFQPSVNRDSSHKNVSVSPISMRKSSEINYASPHAILVYSLFGVILLLIFIVIYLWLAKRKLEKKEQNQEREVLRKNATHQPFLHSDSSAPKSSS
jgi:hypothetical protein